MLFTVEVSYLKTRLCLTQNYVSLWELVHSTIYYCYNGFLIHKLTPSHFKTHLCYNQHINWMCCSMSSLPPDLPIAFMSTCTMNTLQVHHTVCSQGIALFLILGMQHVNQS